MPSKQPFYTALGWTVWQLGKRYARRRAAAVVPRRRTLLLGTVVVGAAVVGLAVATSAGDER